MKKIAYLFCVLAVFAFAQNPVYSDPVFATHNDSIIIYYDATLGNQGLMDYSGTDVYVHTGVITENSSSSSDWKYVWMDWPGQGSNANTEKNKLTKVGDNLWKLVIGDPYEYYGCPTSEKILQLAFVFRNSTAIKKGKDVGDTDIYLSLFESGVTTVWIKPTVHVDYGKPERSPVFYSADASEGLHIEAMAGGIGVEVESMKLLLNDVEIYQISNDSISYDISSGDLLNEFNYLTAIGISGTIQDTSDVMCVVKYSENTATRPTGLQDGITIESSSSITLSIFAPYKEFVHVIGDFNDWKVGPTYQMKKDSLNADSTWFWLTLTDLPDSELGFQYLVDGDIRIADPYSTLILDPWNDSWISSTVFPNLKAYPEGKTWYPVGVMDTDTPVFTWTDGDYVKPNTDNLVIYELLLRDWSYAHSYQSLIDSINYFKRLGITAIELMPIQEFEGNESWGYNPMFFFAPDKYYGTAQKLKELVNLYHMNGIAVIMDVVYNHATGQAPMVRLYNEGTYGAPTAENPWYNTVAKHPYNVFYDMNHESSCTKFFLDRANRYWIEEFHIDGYRFDLSKGFTQTNSGTDVSAWGEYDASRIAILRRMADKMWEADSTAYVILEHFGGFFEENELSNYGMMLWRKAQGQYSEASMGYLGGSDFSAVYHGSYGFNKPHAVGYMESHDEERMTYSNKEYGNSSGTYNIKYENTALDRMELCTVFFLSIPGPKMIWQFGELGYDYSINYGGRLGNKPIKWEYYDEPDRKDVYNLYSIMNFLRANYPVFSNETTGVELSVGNGVAGKRIKLSGAGPNVVILGNFDVVETTAIPAFQHAGRWFEYFRDDTLMVTNTNEGIVLAPGEYRIYTDQKLMESPVAIETVIPRAFVLKQNYPNPFNPKTTISYLLTADSNVELSIYDITGRKITTMVNDYQGAGHYTLQFDASHLASGVYVYKINAGRHSETKKMVVLK